jgi:hypothetical protein
LGQEMMFVAPFCAYLEWGEGWDDIRTRTVTLEVTIGVALGAVVP